MTTKIIMDTDPGIDDAAALTMAINDPNIDLKLVNWSLPLLGMLRLTRLLPTL